MKPQNPFPPDSHFGKQVEAALAEPVKRPRRPVKVIQPEARRDGDTLTFQLPLPHRILHKNGRTKNQGWKASEARTAKNLAYYQGLSVRPAEPWNAARIDAEFWTQNRLDDDGAWSWIVCYRDGIAKALNMNDRDFTCGTVTQHTGRKSEGKRQVVIRITKSGPY